MGQKLNFFLYHKDWMIVAGLPLLFLPLPLIVKGPEALCGYLLLLMGGYWCSEALPLGVTSLIPVFLIPLFGFMTAKEVCPLYFKEINMMLTGGLIVALAIEKCNLHRRIALKVLLTIGVSPRWLMLGFMVPTWFLSMWISNTATSAMMMPIVIEVIYQMETVEVDDIKSTKIEVDNLAFESDSIAKGTNDSPVEDTNVICIAMKPPAYPSTLSSETNSDDVPMEKRNTVAVIELDSHADAATNLDYYEEKIKEPHVITPKNASNMSKGLVISIAYSANCGGTGTLIGTGVNLVMKGMADDLWQDTFQRDSPVNFTTWMGWGFPISLLNLIVVWLWLQIYFVGPREFFGCGKKRDKSRERAMKAVIMREYQKLGGITVAEIQVAILFFILVLLWFFRQPDFMPGWALLFPKGYMADSVPAILIGVICFALPSEYKKYPVKGERPSYIMDWNMMTQKFPWSVILLLGGGFALAEATTTSGLSDWIGNLLTGLNALPNWVLVMLLVYIVTLVTQFTSNTATASLMLPIVRSMALKLNMNPLYLMLPITVATQLAFMLPVATPPNAVAFTAGVLEVLDMVKAGTILNILCTLVVTLATHSWGMVIFGLNSSPFVNATLNNATVPNITTLLY